LPLQAEELLTFCNRCQHLLNVPNTSVSEDPRSSGLEAAQALKNFQISSRHVLSPDCPKCLPAPGRPTCRGVLEALQNAWREPAFTLLTQPQGTLLVRTEPGEERFAFLLAGHLPEPLLKVTFGH
jgi:hypothetical protein